MFATVLILILLEYGLRQVVHEIAEIFVNVLILILLEYGLRPKYGKVGSLGRTVLILILLEYGLRQIVSTWPEALRSLNPYSIGIWSATCGVCC